MRIHLIGVCGTGMGQLARLLRDAGHDVSGSDMAFDPPMGPTLEAAGIRCLRGYDAAHVTREVELVVVGNAIRRDNPEAVRTAELGLPRSSMSGALRERFLVGRRSLVVAGTHGKTTTSSMCAWILAHAGLEPGFFIGGLPKNFPSGAAIGSDERSVLGARQGKRSVLGARQGKRSVLGARQGKRSLTVKPAPFVVEGDEYDAVYWDKKPKFFDYVGVSGEDVAIVTSVEYDHVDIYASPEAYEAEFADFVRRVPEGGLVVADARDPRARAITLANARARTAFYGLDGDDTGEVAPTWSAALAPPDPTTGAQPFDLYAGGSYCGRSSLKVPGAHNVRNAVGAIAACSEGFGVPIERARLALASFEGVRRRQDLLGTPGGVFVYDDFAHHPTAVDETLRALRARHTEGRLWAVFEPRSATACRNVHQREYVPAFKSAARVLFAPLGRANVPEGERLDVERLACEIGERATAAESVEAILGAIVREAKAGDVVALLSNGAFGGIHGKLLAALEARG